MCVFSIDGWMVTLKWLMIIYKYFSQASFKCASKNVQFLRLVPIFLIAQSPCSEKCRWSCKKAIQILIKRLSLRLSLHTLFNRQTTPVLPIRTSHVSWPMIWMPPLPIVCWILCSLISWCGQGVLFPLTNWPWIAWWWLQPCRRWPSLVAWAVPYKLLLHS